MSVKRRNIEIANILLEQRGNEDYFKNEIINLLYPNLNESKHVINESIVLDILSWVKTVLTSHRLGELMTSLVKIIYKWLGVDKDMTGYEDKCEKLEGDKKGECGKLFIQKVADFLHGLHEKIMKPIEFLAAAIKFKTLKPTEEQKQEAKGLSKKLFNGILLGCLVYYVSKMGIEISHGNLGHASIYLGGVGIKLSELINKWNHSVHEINSTVPK